ncbi:MAG: diphosphate--fructose-6-phosphate 1-phosphotransferase [bacterium]|nr:diphosphate--fructose-6-phosphate 1-phosphotransferase [bacterium]
MKPNALLAQSGGPSPVINSSLLGLIDGCHAFPHHIANIFAARHGVEGILQEDLLDLSQEDPHELQLLRSTPCAGAIGTCRYKLGPANSDDVHRILDVFAAHNVGFFFYIGGNDSMDTADKIARLAHQRSIPLTVVGVPKTIDNDLGDNSGSLIDHTPGYGSAARFWALLVQNANEENAGISTSEPVSVYQTMGRKSGFITAAARLGDPDRRLPLQLYLPESHHSLDSLTHHVHQSLRRHHRCIVIVSEGFDVGSLGEKRDPFGHIEYGASETTVAQVVVNHLNRLGLPARGHATGQVPGVLQRDVSIYASTVDLDEAYNVARHAVAIAIHHGSGWMATIIRDSSSPYRIHFDKVPLASIANAVRTFPAHWLSPDQLDVTDDFISYARPLIGDHWPTVPLENGLQRFARLRRVPLPKKLPPYLPHNFRT